ncbi:hypothetical protein RFI_33671, partial [Reticulomyxa filosa]
SPEYKIDNEVQRSKINFNSFKNSIKLNNVFHYHKKLVNSIDYSIFDDRQIICSGSIDSKITLFDFDNKTAINRINVHKPVTCAKFSKYHYNNNKKNVICYSSIDKYIRFLDCGNKYELEIIKGNNDK